MIVDIDERKAKLCDPPKAFRDYLLERGTIEKTDNGYFIYYVEDQILWILAVNGKKDIERDFLGRARALGVRFIRGSFQRGGSERFWGALAKKENLSLDIIGQLFEVKL